jgi:hypothetical protein
VTQRSSINQGREFIERPARYEWPLKFAVEVKN